MSVTAPDARRDPFLILPGFMPDAVGFALRTTAALLLAYLIAFWSQLASASTAGLCVAIVAQSSPGMAMSKAFYRILGTVLGGVAAVAIVGVFGQDRTMMLAAFTLWLGACSFVAALLRDFRSYGAVLCGYTVGIIAITNIDSPQDVLLTTLDRVAAILLGVACVALVNTTLFRKVAFENLVAGLHRALAEMTALGDRTVAGQAPPGPAESVRQAAEILAFTSEASYAATEFPDGFTRITGARTAIAALLSMVSASRAVAHGRGATGHAATPREVFLLERTAELREQACGAELGLKTLENGGRATPYVRLSRHYDGVGAALSALRTMLAVGLGAVFCVMTGWPGVTGLLVQQAAFTALLGMQADPSAAAVTFAWSLPLPALAAGMVGFVLLPGVSGFTPFALAVGPCVFLFALLARHPRTAKFGPALMLYFALLLAPSNVEAFNLAAYMNNLVVQVVAILFMVLAFRLILPVSRKRQLYRVAQAILHDLRKTLRDGRPLDPAPRQSLKYDRLARAQLLLGRPTPARVAVFNRLHAFAELDTALRRAWSGLDEAVQTAPGLAATLAAARAALLQPDPAPLEAAAAALLAHPGFAARPDMARAISGLYGAHILLAQEARALRHYRIVKR